MKRVNWKELRNYQVLLKEFSEEKISGRQLYSVFKNTELGGEVRELVRSGVKRARIITRKALERMENV